MKGLICGLLPFTKYVVLLLMYSLRKSKFVWSLVAEGHGRSAVEAKLGGDPPSKVLIYVY